MKRVKKQLKMKPVAKTTVDGVWSLQSSNAAEMRARAIRYIEKSLAVKRAWREREQATLDIDAECGIASAPNNARALDVVVIRLKEVLTVLRNA